MTYNKYPLKTSSRKFVRRVFYLQQVKFKSMMTTVGACSASAVVFSIAQSVQGCELLAFVALIPVGVVLQPRRLGHTLACLALFNGLYTAVTMHWLRYAYSGFEWVLPIVGLYAAVFMVIPSLGCALVRSSRCQSVGLLALPFGLALAELVARRSPIAMTWALFGQPAANWPALAQVTAIGGPEVLTLMVLATNGAMIMMLRKAARPTRVVAFLLGPVLLLAVGVGGMIRLSGPRVKAESFHVAVIQPYVRSVDKADHTKRSDILARYDRMIDQVTQSSADIDLVVLPETAVRGVVRYEDDLTEWVKAVILRTRLPFLFGSLDQSEDGEELFNVAVMITPYNTVAFYRRQYLMPIAEYTPEVWPVTGIFRWLSRNIPTITPGSETTVFELATGPRLGTMICYEDVLPNLANRYAGHDVDLLIAPINTERFRQSSQPRQHVRRAQLTAIATGLPMVRCTNSGISCTIDRRGRVSQRITDTKGKVVLVEGARVMKVLLDNRATIYRWAGDWLAAGIYVGGILFLIFGCQVAGQ